MNISSFIAVWKNYTQAKASLHEKNRYNYDHPQNISSYDIWKEAGYESDGLFDIFEFGKIDRLRERAERDTEFAQKLNTLGTRVDF